MNTSFGRTGLPQEKSISALRPIRSGQWRHYPHQTLRTNEDSQTGEKQEEIQPPTKHTDSPGGAPEAREVFKSFTDTAYIWPFGLKKLPISQERKPYNDDIKIEHFQSSSRHYADKQRRGVADEHIQCLSMTAHIDLALNIPCFLSLSVPLPTSTLKAEIFVRDATPTEIVKFLVPPAFRCRQSCTSRCSNRKTADRPDPHRI